MWHGENVKLTTSRKNRYWNILLFFPKTYTSSSILFNAFALSNTHTRSTPSFMHRDITTQWSGSQVWDLLSTRGDTTALNGTNNRQVGLDAHKARENKNVKILVFSLLVLFFLRFPHCHNVFFQPCCRPLLAFGQTACERAASSGS